MEPSPRTTKSSPLTVTLPIVMSSWPQNPVPLLKIPVSVKYVSFFLNEVDSDWLKVPVLKVPVFVSLEVSEDNNIKSDDEKSSATFYNVIIRTNQ